MRDRAIDPITPATGGHGIPFCATRLWRSKMYWTKRSNHRMPKELIEWLSMSLGAR